MTDRELKAVANDLTVRLVTGCERTPVYPGDVQAKAEAAFKRSAEVDRRRIHMATKDGKVILSGHVRSFAERQEVERAAWAALGGSEIDDRITVVP